MIDQDAKHSRAVVGARSSERLAPLPAVLAGIIALCGCATTKAETADMTQTWPIIAVADVAHSSGWYMKLLDAQETHAGATVFNQIVDEKGTPLLCLHHWGPSGPGGDHDWPSLSSPSNGQAGNGLLLWFVVGDLEAAWQRARSLDAVIEEAPNTDNGTGMPAFVVRDPDGYHVAVNEARP